MTYMSHEKPVERQDSTGFSYDDWEKLDDIRIYIVQKSANAYRTNELHLTESAYVGFTKEKLNRGDRVGGKLIVDYVGPKAVSLSAIGNANE